MQRNKVYNEVLEFASSRKQNVIDFRPSEKRKAHRERIEGLWDDTTSELRHHLVIEHLQHMARVRAYHYLAEA